MSTREIDLLITCFLGGGNVLLNDVPGVGSCPGTTFCTGAGGLVCQGPTPVVETCNFTDDDCDANDPVGIRNGGRF